MIKPNEIGRITTCTIDQNILTTSTFIDASAMNHVKNGVSNGATTVDTQVMPTDNARSPFAKYVITLDAVPPGQHPTSITPIANSCGNLKIIVNSHAIEGMTINCARHPITTSFGRLKTILKSDSFNVNPMPNMTAPSM